jgi:hypothetical protein
MKLMTKELEKKFPKLGETDTKWPKKVIAKFFCPWSFWTWYAVEYDPDISVCFGFVYGEFPEWGDFSIAELEELQGPLGLGIERDLYFGDKWIDSSGKIYDSEEKAKESRAK